MTDEDTFTNYYATIIMICFRYSMDLEETDIIFHIIINFTLYFLMISSPSAKYSFFASWLSFPAKVHMQCYLLFLLIDI